MIRFHLHMTAEVAHPLAHTSDANAGALRLNFRQLFCRYSLPLILDFESDTVGIARDTNGGSLTPAVAMDVSQAFLHQSKHHQLHFAGESLEIGRNFESDFQATALGQALDIPAKRFG